MKFLGQDKKKKEPKFIKEEKKDQPQFSTDNLSQEDAMAIKRDPTKI